MAVFGPVRAADDSTSIRLVQRLMDGEMPGWPRRAPTRELPDWLVRLIGLFDREVRSVTPELGARKDPTTAMALMDISRRHPLARYGDGNTHHRGGPPPSHPHRGGSSSRSGQIFVSVSSS